MRILLTGSNGFIGRRIAADAAALASPWARPEDYRRDNVDATRHVLEWAADHGRPRIVHVSSSSVLYRDADQFGLTEESPTPPAAEQINAYSRSKFHSEQLVRRYPGPWIVLRPRAVFGVGDTVLLPRVVAAARRGVLPRFTRRDGQVVRCDLTPVGSVSHYVLEALARGAGGVSGVLNITNGETVELNAFVDDVLRRLGVTARRPGVPVGVAMSLAGAAERVSALAGYRGEPPITRFGVSMFARSKTFDVSALRAQLGPPPVGIGETVDELVAAWSAR